MKQPSFFRRLLGKLRRGKAAPPQPQPPAAKPDEKPKRRRTDSSFEPLEGRIAPALLLNASTIQFTDVDGDLVTVTFSKGLFDLGSAGLNAALDGVFKFKTAGVVRDAANGGSAAQVHELATLDLFSLAPTGSANPANGISFSITSEKVTDMGDGFVNVGYIRAASSSIFGIALGNVVVDGDIGQIDAGDRTKAVAIKSLTVQSWGRMGLTTQVTTPSLESNVTSAIGKITVIDDFVDATLRVVNGDVASKRPGKVGTISIGGNLEATAAVTTADAALISVAGGIDRVSVDNILGGAGQNSGKISAGGKIGSLTLSGDLIGGAGRDSGQVSATMGYGTIVLQKIQAGAGEASGRIVSSGSVTSFSVEEIAGHHATTGVNAGKNAGSIGITGNIKNLTIAGNLSGGHGENSGSVSVGGTISKLTIGGHIIGGEGVESIGSGRVIAGAGIGKLTVSGEAQEYLAVETTPGAEGVSEVQTIDLGDVLGREGTFTLTGASGQTTSVLSALATAAQIETALEALANIGAGNVDVTISGGKLVIAFVQPGARAELFRADVVQSTLVGSTDDTSGSISTNGSIETALIENASSTTAGILKAGAGSQSGSIAALGNIGKLILNGHLDGSTASPGLGAGGITIGGNVKTLTINGNLIGGEDELTGAIAIDGTLGKATIAGSLIGGAGTSSGSFIVGSKAASILVTGSLDGGTGANSASLIVGNDTTKPGDLGKLVINGVLLGDGVDSASVRTGGKLVNATIGAGATSLVDVLAGGDGSNSASVIGGRGIGKLNIVGHVTGGEGINSATIQATGLIANLTVIGNLNGGDGEGSGSVKALERELPLSFITGDLGTITIKGSVTGGDGNASGQIMAEGSAKKITTGALTGAEGIASGSIITGTGDAAFLDEYRTIGGLQSLKVLGNITGGIGAESGQIHSAASAREIGIAGSITGSAIQSGRDIGKLTVVGTLTDVRISALGSAKATAKADVAIGSVSITGGVTDTVILAGYDRFGNPANGNAQIGSVKVVGNWTASSIAAGVIDVDDDGFGDVDDAAITTGGISRIASIVITGNVSGSASAGDHFGFIAQSIGKISINGIAQALTTGKDTIDLAGSPATNDTSIREVL